MPNLRKKFDEAKYALNVAIVNANANHGDFNGVFDKLRDLEQGIDEAEPRDAEPSSLEPGTETFTSGKTPEA